MNEVEAQIAQTLGAQALVTDPAAGSISAEHGIGMYKRDALERFATPAQWQLTRTVKQALDPEDLMNPGKVLRRAREEFAARTTGVIGGGTA